MSNEWFERGELPPTGVECECFYSSGGKWVKVKTLDAQNPSSREMACVTVDDDGIYGRLFFGYRFRPIRTEREKVVEVAAPLIESLKFSSYAKIAEALYDAGLLRLPEDK